MTEKEKLLEFKAKIEKSTQFNDEFKNLIGIELFDFIYSNEPIKAEFEKRRYYLKNLADDKDFNTVQDNLFEVIQKILKLTSLKEVKERQKEWNNAVISRLKGVKGKEKNEDFLTLPELYIALQDKNNYYRLSDNSYFSPLDGEISLENHIVPVKKQYEGNVETFFQEVFSTMLQDSGKKGLELKELLNEYNDYWYKLDELLYRIPVKLHTKSFEDFFSDCTEFYQRKGYEFHYTFLKGATTRNNEARFIKVKKNTITVINDLIDVAEWEEKRLLISSDPFIKEAVKNAQEVANRLNEIFLKDRQNIQISRAWFEALSNNAKPALEAYQTYVAQTLINFEPFRRTLEENARTINTISKSIIMPNLEAIKPMLKELEKTTSKVGEMYHNKPLVLTSPMPPRIAEAIQTNRIVDEIKELRHTVEELTAIALNPVKVEPQNDKKKTEKVMLSLDKRGRLCNIKGKCYAMGEASKRHKLIRFLVENSDYQPTRLITQSIGYQNNQTTSGEIIKIRKNIGRDLNIKGKEFLEVKKDSGYRINPKYKIKIND